MDFARFSVPFWKDVGGFFQKKKKKRKHDTQNDPPDMNLTGVWHRFCKVLGLNLEAYQMFFQSQQQSLARAYLEFSPVCLVLAPKLARN